MKAVVAIALTLAVGRVDAAPFTARELQSYCADQMRPAQSDNDQFNSGIRYSMCLSYISGFSAGLSIGADLGDSQYRGCKPREMSGKEAIIIVTEYLRRHPEDLDKGANYAASMALMATSQCAKNKKS